jgi:hypothetical protein
MRERGEDKTNIACEASTALETDSSMALLCLCV